MFKIRKSWYDLLKDEFDKAYYQQLTKFLTNEYQNYTVYPKAENVFNALNLVPYDKVKVVIIGQDPYHEPNQANGLSFSVQKGVEIPRSLQNIYKELHDDCGCYIPNHGDLTKWAEQGVLLLNPYLTVVAHKPLSHKIKEYDLFFNDIMNELNNTNRPIVFLLWGNNAKKYHKLLNNSLHLVIETAHPSPLSANQGGWFNSGCFLKTNEFLKANNEKEIIWMK